MSALTMIFTRRVPISLGTMSGAQCRRRLDTEGFRTLSASSNIGRISGVVELSEILGSLARV